MDVRQGLLATPQRYGYGRYFRFRNNQGDVVPGDLFLSVNFDRWSDSGGTPLWLWISRTVSARAPQLRVSLPSVVDYGSNGPYDVPIRLTTGTEYDRVLADVVRQAREVGEMVEDQ